MEFFLVSTFHFLRVIMINRRYVYINILKFRMWFKYGLKAQKLLAQGIALGIMAISKAPCKGKSFVYCQVFESFCPYYYICTWKNKELKIFISANFC